MFSFKKTEYLVSWSHGLLHLEQGLGDASCQAECGLHHSPALRSCPGHSWWRDPLSPVPGPVLWEPLPSVCEVLGFPLELVNRACSYLSFHDLPCSCVLISQVSSHPLKWYYGNIKTKFNTLRKGVTVPQSIGLPMIILHIYFTSSIFITFLTPKLQNMV